MNVGGIGCEVDVCLN